MPAATPCWREIEQLVTSYPPYSDEREDLASALYGTSETLNIDGEGPGDPDRKAEEPCRDRGRRSRFVGLGHKFQIWEPERFRAQLAEATEKVRALKRQLGSRRAAQDAHGARE